MVAVGIPNPTNGAVRKAVSGDELVKHCRRRTRGVQECTSSLEALILSFSAAVDTLGVPLLKEETEGIWEEQKQHIRLVCCFWICIAIFEEFVGLYVGASKMLLGWNFIPRLAHSPRVGLCCPYSGVQEGPPP